jgi:hypothetical protein
MNHEVKMAGGPFPWCATLVGFATEAGALVPDCSTMYVRSGAGSLQTYITEDECSALVELFSNELRMFRHRRDAPFQGVSLAKEAA